MTNDVEIIFAKQDTKPRGVVVFLAGKGPQYGSRLAEVDEGAGGLIQKAIKLKKFKGNKKSVVDLLSPAGLKEPRILVIGIGDLQNMKNDDWIRLGGTIKGRLTGTEHSEATIILDLAAENEEAEKGITPEAASDIGLGILLRNYKFDKYKSKKSKTKDDDEGSDTSKSELKKITIQCDDPNASRKLFADAHAVYEGVALARDLVNEPANVLNPVTFAERSTELTKLGVDVEVLDEKDLAKVGMRALLGVGQGSFHDSRVVVMKWMGARSKKAQPLAFVGKGVCFDTGGISIKPAAGMEDMKGDMGGAAAVVGLMHTLAARKARVNAIGIIGLVENMPGHEAQRPGDIVISLSGQTIEVINTDAEGRLVLADLLWYLQDKYKPEFMVNLATLTGAIIIALGKEHAGLFSNDDELSDNLSRAGVTTGEKVWRMPLGSDYDKQIDSKIADMKNIGGRTAGSITAAQFLQRFVNNTPWAHLDVAGTAMAAPHTEINRSWGSGYGVRLLNQLVRDNYET